MRLTEHARAKVNLTLTVHGRRVDGFHELSSVVAFADDAADLLEMDFTRPPGLSITGPFAQHLVGDANLILDAVSATTRAMPELAVGYVTLHKALPVAAGIGGGSADAAAALRLIQRGNPHVAVDPAVWSRLAASLGSDVPVCLENQMSTMSGRGEAVVPLSAPPLAAVLVNPMAPVPSSKTAAVFKALAAPPLESPPQAWRPPWTRSTPMAARATPEQS
jgi:4-diphosphocytidyl-2-C-methyl-D-erythritol kinase